MKPTKLNNQLNDGLFIQIYNELDRQLNDQLYIPIDNELGRQMRLKLHWQIIDQTKNTIDTINKTR